jgi:hypothetical protein
MTLLELYFEPPPKDKFTLACEAARVDFHGRLEGLWHFREIVTGGSFTLPDAAQPEDIQRRADEIRASFATERRLTPLERSSMSGFTVIELIMVICLMLGAYWVGSLVLEALGWAIPAFSKMLVGGFVVLALLSCIGGGSGKKEGK